MKRKIKLTLLGGLMITAAVMSYTAFSQAKEKAMMKEMAKEIMWSADELKYAEKVPGVTEAVLWGDPAKGASGSITKFVGAVKHGMHTHSSTVKGVVIAGTFWYKSATMEKKLGPGSYFVIPAGLQHDSGSEADGCTFFSIWSGKFDMKMMEGMPEKK